MTMLSHLFLDGEFLPRERLLAGLSLEQVKLRPAQALHSTYEELWHATKWQRIVVERDEDGGESWVAGEGRFPPAAPEHESEWYDSWRRSWPGANAPSRGRSRPRGSEPRSIPG